MKTHEAYEMEQYQEKLEDYHDTIALGEGDLGKTICQIRDGNHRAFGAIYAGEDQIPVIVARQHGRELAEADDDRSRKILDQVV
jgi:hypothetical protein